MAIESWRLEDGTNKYLKVVSDRKDNVARHNEYANGGIEDAANRGQALSISEVLPTFSALLRLPIQ